MKVLVDEFIQEDSNVGSTKIEIVPAEILLPTLKENGGIALVYPSMVAK